MNKVAIICPIKDETTYIHKFFEYYSQHIKGADTYILDFGSSKEYIDDVLLPNANVIRSNESILNAPAVFFEIKKNMKILNKQYDFVIPIDVDEILYYNKPGGLGKFLRNISKKIDIITCRGYEVIHIPSLQDDLKLNEPWFKQLDYWYNSDVFYAKTLITRQPLHWVIGFHRYFVNEVPYQTTEKDKDPNLFLIHIHRHNFKTTIKRHTKWANMEWSNETIDNNFNYHYRIKEESKIKEWYFGPILDKFIYKIPEDIKNNINI